MVGLGRRLLAALVAQAPARSRGRDHVEPHSLLGNYLAGRFARAQQDTESAADVLRRRADAAIPTNEVLLEQAFQMETMTGNWPRALPLAEKLAGIQQSHRMSHFLLGVAAFKTGDLHQGRRALQGRVRKPDRRVDERHRARLDQACRRRRQRAPLPAVDLPKQPEWAQFYLRYHRALMADMSGRKAEARTALKRCSGRTAARCAPSLAYAQHAAHYGDLKLAKQVLKDQLDKSQGEPHPLAQRSARQASMPRQKMPLLITTPRRKAWPKCSTASAKR